MFWGVPTAKAKGASNYYVIVIWDQTVSIWHFSLLQDPGAVDFMLKASSFRVEGGSCQLIMLLKLEIFKWDWLTLWENLVQLGFPFVTRAWRLNEKKILNFLLDSTAQSPREQQLLEYGEFSEFRSPAKETVMWLPQFKIKDPNFGVLRVDNFNPWDYSF